MIKKRSQKEVDNYTTQAKQVVKHVLGKHPKKLHYKPAGHTNFVFEAITNHGVFIVRLSTAAEKLKDFKKEQWTIKKVSELGIPVAEIVDVGDQVIEYPYMVQKKVEGTEALYHPDKKKVLNQMGEITARINTIKTKGFGKCFEWSQDEELKNTTWKEFLEKELELGKRLQLFRQHRILTKENINRLKTLLESFPGTKSQTMLNHGDMRRKNVLVNESAEVAAIIDWEESCSNIAPTWDLSIALHDLSVDDKQYFLEGYGISPKAYAASVNSIKALNIINYASAIEDVIKTKNHRLLDFYKLRLGGHFDLYSL